MKEAAARLAEEALYEQVAAEIAAGIRRDGLWAKAIVQSGGSEERARVAYINLRVQSLKDEAAVMAEMGRIAADEARKNQVLNQLNEKKQKDAEERRTPAHQGLLEAVNAGNLSKVIGLLNQGISPYGANEQGKLLPEIAQAQKDKAMAELLIKFRNGRKL